MVRQQVSFLCFAVALFLTHTACRSHVWNPCASHVDSKVPRPCSRHHSLDSSSRYLIWRGVEAAWCREVCSLSTTYPTIQTYPNTTKNYPNLFRLMNLLRVPPPYSQYEGRTRPWVAYLRKRFWAKAAPVCGFLHWGSEQSKTPQTHSLWIQWVYLDFALLELN